MLSAAPMRGREPGTKGSVIAQQYISKRYAELGVKPYTTNYLQVFRHPSIRTGEGTNVLGFIKGVTYPDQYIVVSAHYDHLGQRGRRWYPGADDNASGVAMMLWLAADFRNRSPRYSVIFLATDGEEKGLLGAKAFIKRNTLNIVANLNLDMLGRSKRTYFVTSPLLRQPMRDALVQSSDLCLIYRRRHKDRSRLKSIDFVKASDHYTFASHGIEYFFVSGSLHGDYHLPSDTRDKMTPMVVANTADTVLKTFRLLEDVLPQLSD